METLHISPDEHLQRVMGDPSDAILKQRELSEATYPLLVSYLGWLRRLNGVQNKNDVIRQNEQFFSEFMHLCEHNLLFFLTVTGRFDVIRALFEDKNLLAKEIALLEEIEKEQAQAAAANLQNFVFVPRKNTVLIQQIEVPKPLPPPTSEWEKSLYGLTNMDLYLYYEAEMKRITHIYHTKQIKLIDATYDENIALMRKAINLLHQNENTREETKQKAIVLYKELIAIKEKMEAEYHELSLWSEVPLEIEFIEKQRRVKEERLKEAQEALEAFFEEVRHEVPQLQTIYEEHQELIMSFKKESQTIHNEWEKEIEVLSTHYEHVRTHALDDINSSLNLIIDELKKCPVDELNEEQINQLDTTLMQLKEYKEKLKTVDSYDSTQVLLSKCNKELETIANMVKPLLSEDAKSRFDININLMKQMFVAPQNYVEHLSSTLESASSLPGTDMSSELSIPSPITVSKELKIEVQSKSAGQFASDEQHHSEDVSCVDSQNSVHTQRYRFFASSTKPGAELIEFEPEKQHNYELTLQELSSVLSDLNEEVEPEISEKIKEIENLIKDAKSIGSARASPSHIQKICEACNLGIDYEPLNHAKDNLASILHIKNSPQRSV